MFNLKEQSGFARQPVDLLRAELMFLDIHSSGHECKLTVGDEEVSTRGLKDCIGHIQQAVKELKIHLWRAWSELADLAKIIPENNAGNQGSLENLVFLHSVKNSYLLSKVFSELDEINKDIHGLFNVDSASVHGKLMERFSRKYLEVRLLHQLIMAEIYRLKVIQRYLKLTKQAQVSGPWANLDIPMKERVWAWEEDEEYFAERQKARREQVRYNPENNKQGFFFVWQDLTRDPYLFEDIKRDSPYKSRHLMTIP